MNENISSVPENEVMPGDIGMEDAPAVEDDWDDIDLSDATDSSEMGDADAPVSEEDAGHEADQQTDDGSEQQEAASEEQPTQEGQEEADQPFLQLKRHGETTGVTREQATVLAQKGLDYDHVRGERDAARGRVQELEGFLNELAAPSGMSIEDLIDATRAQVLADRDGIDHDIALQRVKLDRERRDFDAERQRIQDAQAEQQRADQARTGSFLRFAQAYPDVDPTTIPKEVWDEMAQGTDLTDAYARYEAKTLRAENEELRSKLETVEKNVDNKQRSTGSQKTAGQTSKRDPIDDDWYDGT